ncbi:hypothetical protein ACH41H_06915 [Streptomyces sp. NPDC020800]|uniref:hypothetical protein n=1 Tax=Streptomyces sp. NPDC020800 TaxID=3365092 RepID=UPI003796A274
MLRFSGDHGTHSSHRGGPDPRRLRLLALVGVVAAAVALPLAVASAGQVGDVPRPDGQGSDGQGAEGQGGGTAVTASPDDAKLPSVSPSRSPLLLGLGLATAARCGPELTSPDGVEAQTCVLTQGEDTWARTYYRNTTGRAVDSVLSLMEPGGRTVQARCPAGADDQPATCDTPREHTRGALDGYTAVSEFASPGAEGPLLLRSASNSRDPKGS